MNEDKNKQAEEKVTEEENKKSTLECRCHITRRNTQRSKNPRLNISFPVPAVLLPKLLKVLLYQKLRFLLRNKPMRPGRRNSLPPNARFDFRPIHVASELENPDYLACAARKAKRKRFLKTLQSR
jgi:hypothetical protein